MAEPENIYKKPPLGISPEGRAYRAVVIDDSPVVRLKLRQILLSVRFSVTHEFENGGSALQYFKDTGMKPDILFVDIEMPVMDGIEVVAALHPILPDARFIMVTSHGDKEVVERLIQAGIHGYIKKPFDRDSMLKHLEKILLASLPGTPQRNSR